MIFCNAPRLGRWLAAGLGAAALALHAQPLAPPLPIRPLPVPVPGASPEAPPAEADELIQLGKFKVSGNILDETIDPTGMDAPEAERAESPFSNDLIMVETADDDPLHDIGTELSAIAAAPPADTAAGVNRVNLKGFPTPRQRNGFTQVGMPEILNPGGSESIQGPLTPVVGRAAPGGIQNFISARPRGRKSSRLSLVATSKDYLGADFELSGQLVPKKAWHRFSFAANQRLGPQPFTYNRNRAANGAVVWKLNRAWSSMVQFDYDERAANAPPNLADYRATASAKILGPYRPLADFNIYGPNAGYRKRTASAVLQLEGQIGRRVSVRASLQGFTRSFDEDRWTTGPFLLDTKKFSGIREPQHVDQPFSAVTGQIDVTTRFFVLKADHKITVSLDTTSTDYERVQSALTIADRNALPADVRFFDPAAPNYFRPAYEPGRFSRFITNRAEQNRYTGIFVSERAAFMKGRLVVTAGVRRDFVTIDVSDRKPGAVQPKVSDETGEVTGHFGANFVAVPGKILVFANTSTAFEPSSRVDARTGRVQGNETTLGYEAGGKGLFFERRLALIAMGFVYFNQNISRRNPLYDDPVLDANQTQPQLVAAGEERFTGGSLEGRYKVSEAFSLGARATYNRAITTASPDLPEEIGRELSRFPWLTGGLTARYTFGRDGRWPGLSIGAGLTYVSDTVSSYENKTHVYLAYPSYTLVSLSASYRWKVGNFNHSLSATVRNALDYDLLASVARVGGERDYGISYGLSW